MCSQCSVGAVWRAPVGAKNNNENDATSNFGLFLSKSCWHKWWHRLEEHNWRAGESSMVPQWDWHSHSRHPHINPHQKGIHCDWWWWWLGKPWKIVVADFVPKGGGGYPLIRKAINGSCKISRHKMATCMWCHCILDHFDQNSAYFVPIFLN